MGMYDLVVWDWNGTLLDDRWLCVDVVNGMLARRGLPQLDEERYRDIFGFPIVDYYRRAGFDFSTDSLEVLAVEYLSVYDARVGECGLHSGIVEILRTIAEAGAEQVILSASKQDSLENAVGKYGIGRWFSTLQGLEDGHAVSKVAAGRRLLDTFDVPADRTLMIGDTDHDGEVSDALGIDLALTAEGHQSIRHLSADGRRVFGTNAELLDWVAAIFTGN